MKSCLFDQLPGLWNLLRKIWIIPSKNSFRLFSSGFSHMPFNLFRATLVCHTRRPVKKSGQNSWLTGRISVGEQCSTCPPTPVVSISSRKGKPPGQERFSCPPILLSWPQPNFTRSITDRFSSSMFQQNSVLMEIDMLLQSKFSTKYNERQICLINYLKNQMKPGSNFFKSKYIAKDTGLSSKEVGTNMALLSEICPEFKIERYSYSNSTTWLVTTPQV